jgi:acetoin utilization deacetylase AcuC-like enzyme
MAISVFTHPKCRKHNMDPEHPECPERLSQIQDQLIASGLASVVDVVQGTKIDREHLYHAHSHPYIDELFYQDEQLQAKASSEDNPHIWLDDDTIMMRDSLTAALYAAGCATDAVDEVFARADTRAFCAIRPPGHHACHDKAMGFCLINNVAVAATYAQHQHGIERVAIVDFDVHHGNGTEDIFHNEPSVLFCSSFQHPFYPFGGVENQPDHFYPVPLKAGDDGAVFRDAVAHWFSAIDAFAPELILISAGFDAHQEDDLGHVRLVEDDYVWITTELKALADKHCQGRVVSLLEGGYALSALGRSAVAHVKALL